MAIGKDKDKIVTIVTKTAKTTLEELAVADKRSLSAYCSIILEDYVKALEEKENK